MSAIADPASEQWWVATPRPNRWRSWDARLSRPGPEHARYDRPDGSKAMPWEPPLEGTEHHLEDLVYRGAELFFDDPEAPVVVCEGEKVADAAAAAGCVAIGLVCGAAGTPGRSVAELLKDRDVVLAPDADDVGRGLMNRFGRALESGIARRLAVVRPPAGVEHGWDLADITPDRIRELVDDAATRWIGPLS